MLILVALVSFLPLSLATPLDVRGEAGGYVATCQRIAKAISSASAVYYPGSTGFANDIEHWVPSSAQVSACSVEPGTVEDASIIIKILGQSNTPFGIKSGGHATAVGFSSTLGVQITLVRLNSVTYDPATNSAFIGMGLTWDQVFLKLQPLNVSVAGGRIQGVGVGGYSQGGGYSWLTNRYGLTIDTIKGFELVLPSGAIAQVTAASNPDLFFGVRGGYSNFGLVTKITMQTYAQGPIWGGLVDYAAEHMDAVNAALADFSNTNTNPDGNVVLNNYWSGGIATASLFLFYNGPTPPADLFAGFLAIPTISNDAKTRPFYDFIIATSVNYLNPTKLRGTFSSVSMPNLTVPVLNEVMKQGALWGKPGSFSSAPLVSFAIEPFYWKSVIRPLNDAAYPHNIFVTPFNLFFAWPNATDDAAGLAAVHSATADLTKAVIQDGQNLTGTVLYPNYALGDTKIEALYGANLPRLKALRAQHDPNGLFLRTGGFKFV